MMLKNLVGIHKNKDVAWFLALVKEHNTRHPLVVHVTSSCLEVSSNVVCSGAKNNLPIVPSFTPVIDARDLKKNDVFACKEILSNCFNLIAVKKNFEFKIVRSNSRSIVFQCVQDGC